MKTTILNIVTIIALVLGTVNFTYAASKADNGVIVNDIGNINKIETHGNVEVYLSNGTKDEVKVFNDYYAENALVQSTDGVLRISSYSPETLVVYVSAQDLSLIAAFDNSSIKSVGNLSFIGLDVNLFDNAYAQLKLDSFGASINAKDRAKADLSGNLTEYSLTYSRSSTINRSELSAEKATETLTQPEIAPRHHHRITVLASL